MTALSLARETIRWTRRARRLVPREDRKVLLSPPRLVARFARFALLHALHRDHRFAADDLAARDPELVELVLDVIRLLAEAWFRLDVRGLEHVPAAGPVLLVGNHSGGLLPMEGFFTALALHDAFGHERVPHALVHDFLLEDPTLERYATRLGMLRAGHGSGCRALGAGRTLLVYPGSDLDTFRPFRDRHRVVLGGRKGFVQLALRARAPIVPVVTAGTHEQLVILTRGDRLAKLFHIHRLARADVFPIVLALPWGLTSGYVPYLPLPAQTSQVFGAPIRWPELGPEDAEDPAVLDRCYREVEATMQAMLDELSAGRRFLLGAKHG